MIVCETKKCLSYEGLLGFYRVQRLFAYLEISPPPPQFQCVPQCRASHWACIWGERGSGRFQDVWYKQFQRLYCGASDKAFAAILGDGSVVTWGNARYGGGNDAVQEQQKNVQQIQATKPAFAAILGDGWVVTWGLENGGGDSSAVQDQLKNVLQIQAAAHGAFAAILGDGSVVTWGASWTGGDSSSVQEQLRNVQQIQATASAFSAICGDGSIVAWGGAGVVTLVQRR